MTVWKWLATPANGSTVSEHEGPGCQGSEMDIGTVSTLTRRNSKLEHTYTYKKYNHMKICMNY